MSGEALAQFTESAFLTYDAPTEARKSGAHADTYRGRFVELVPDERVVEVDEFETSDPSGRASLRRHSSKVSMDSSI